jgi:AI-2 transport protein TqsA
MGRHRLCLELYSVIGSFIATILPTLFAAAQYESFSPAIVMFIGLNIVQFVVGSYIEPRVTGAAVSISPFMVLFAVFFWAMLWGIAGALSACRSWSRWRAYAPETRRPAQLRLDRVPDAR